MPSKITSSRVTCCGVPGTNTRRRPFILRNKGLSIKITLKDNCYAYFCILGPQTTGGLEFPAVNQALKTTNIAIQLINRMRIKSSTNELPIGEEHREANTLYIYMENLALKQLTVFISKYVFF